MSDVSDLLDLLPVYYSRLFPFADYYRWLSYGNGKFRAINQYAMHHIIMLYFSQLSFSGHFQQERIFVYALRRYLRTLPVF